MIRLPRPVRSLFLLLVSPLLVAASALALAVADLVWILFGRKRPEAARHWTAPRCASVVIPNWNGRDLLEKYLPSVVRALSDNPANEILVVDNGSADGSVEYVRKAFPGVRVLDLPRNLGFGGGSNAGFRAARNDVVVLLNSDMRVEPGFLAPLLEGFTDDRVFAVSCQIFFSDPTKRREETGLTEGWWRDGGLRVSHRIDPEVRGLFPCFYGGGGSCAFDRHKFLELGGFDELLAPFYLEDTDLGFLAWKRGWKVLYQPRSVVYHEHRGTIGKRFSEEHIQAALKKNYLLFCWKNIHEPGRLAGHLFFAYAGILVTVIFGDAPGRANLLALWRAFRQLPGAVRSRWRARSLAGISDTETFRRHKGGYFRDRFEAAAEGPVPAPRVLFVSPYPIYPPVHGGGVFMYQTLLALSDLCEVHVIGMLDHPGQRQDNEVLRNLCASAEFLVRAPLGEGRGSSLAPHAVREFENRDLEWLIHRQIYLKQIDVVQLEYTALGQYAARFQHIVCALFEHDVYFQSVARALEYMHGSAARWKARYEYLRALRYELRLLPALDQVQVCTRENREYLETFLPELRGCVQEGLRAGIETSRYEFRTSGRQPDTMLFLGSFRHEPNRVAMGWFVASVLPLILDRRPQARLLVVGSEPPPPHVFAGLGGAVEILGFVDDVRPLLEESAVFVCPILSGSGVRVKLLEAFASGIPAVSTYIGAEGLARIDGEFCRLARTPAEFAERVLAVLEEPDTAAAMAARARAEVEQNWDMPTITRRLEGNYREILNRKRPFALADAALISRRGRA